MLSIIHQLSCHTLKHFLHLLNKSLCAWLFVTTIRFIVTELDVIVVEISVY